MIACDGRVTPLAKRGRLGAASPQTGELVNEIAPPHRSTKSQPYEGDARRLRMEGGQSPSGPIPEMPPMDRISRLRSHDRSDKPAPVPNWQMRKYIADTRSGRTCGYSPPMFNA